MNLMNANTAQIVASPAQILLVEVIQASVGDHRLSSLEREMWNELITRFGDQAIIDYLRRHVSMSKYAPHVSEALEFLGASNSAASALLVLQREVQRVGSWQSPKFDDPAVAHAVSIMGGWEKVCQDLPDPSDRFAYGAFQERFEVALKAAQSEVTRGASVAPLLGRHDANLLALEQKRQLALGFAPAADVAQAPASNRLQVMR